MDDATATAAAAAMKDALSAQLSEYDKSFSALESSTNTFDEKLGALLGNLKSVAAAGDVEEVAAENVAKIERLRARVAALRTSLNTVSKRLDTIHDMSSSRS